MRFSFDEIYTDALNHKNEIETVDDIQSCGDDSEIEYTFIGDISDGLQLKLPKKPLTEKESGCSFLRPTDDSSIFLDCNDASIAAMVDSLDFPAEDLYPPSIRLYGKRRAKQEKETKELEKSNLMLIMDECKNESYLKEDTLLSMWNDHILSLEKNNENLIRLLKQEQFEEEQRQKRILEEERKKAHEKEMRIKAEEKRKLKEQERIRREEEIRTKKQLEEKREEEERKQKALAARKKEEEKIAKESTNFTDINAVFLKNKQMIQEIKTNIVEVVKKDMNLKKLLAQHRRKINPKFGQLTNSMTQLQSILAELSGLIDETKPNQLGYKWILNFVSKAVVSQAETEVAVKPENSLPLAKLCLALLVKYPELKEYLLARFVKKCPFVIGFTCSIDTEEGRKRMGWKRKNDGKWEDDTTYDERMAGIMTLFAVITRLPLPQEIIESVAHPLPISNSWTIVARIANTPVNLLNNTHFIVLAAWWESAAAQFLLAYGRQARKLLDLISNDLTSTVADKKWVGAARLRILYEEWKTAHTINQFPEMIE